MQFNPNFKTLADLFLQYDNSGSTNFTKQMF